MQIKHNKKLAFLFFMLFILNCSTVKYVKESDTISKDLETAKRLVVFIIPNKTIEQEKLLLKDLTNDYISHHKEFIVYPSPKNFNGECAKGFDGVFSLDMNQIETKNKVKILLKGNLKNCKLGKTIWESFAENNFSYDLDENQSLVNTYIQKYGKPIANKVTPFFLMVKSLIENLKSPILTEKEKDEKIEVESEL